MHTQEPLTITLEADPLDCWAEESTASALRALAVWLHSSGLSFRETAGALELFGVTRSYQAVFQWVHRVAEEGPDPPTAKPSRVAVDETVVTINTERHWLYAAIDVEKTATQSVVTSKVIAAPSTAYWKRAVQTPPRATPTPRPPTPLAQGRPPRRWTSS